MLFLFCVFLFFLLCLLFYFFLFFFFNDTATTEIYTLSLHDALPISLFPASRLPRRWLADESRASSFRGFFRLNGRQDRKSTRLNSSHVEISYAVFCLKKKKKKKKKHQKYKNALHTTIVCT